MVENIKIAILFSKVGRYWGILYHDILAGQYCDMTIYLGKKLTERIFNDDIK